MERDGLFHLLSYSAEKNPLGKAVVFKERSLTYEQLLTRALCIAAGAAELGAGPGTRVAIYLDRGMDAIAALYGAMCTGAAYVPVDPRWPIQRIRAVLEDVDPCVLVTDGSLLDAKGLEQLLPDATAVLCTRSRGTGRGRAMVKESVPGTYRITPCKGEESAYILYTSGSTGRPKGVEVSNRAALAFLEWACKEFDLNPDDSMANFASLCFDLSVLDVFGAACSGGTVMPAPSEAVMWPRVGAAWLEQARATVVYTVPWTYRQLVEYGDLDKRNVSELRLAIYAGEDFPPAELVKVMEALRGTDFYNLYGPTETNVCTYYRVDDLSRTRDSSTIPIGTACSGDVVILLDQELRPVGPGGRGEIHVAGPSLMTGYFGNPESTRAAFREIEIDGVVSKFYKTGDMAEYGEDGLLYLVGRKDRMVKRRGARIELGELERVALEHDGISEAAAVFEKSGLDGRIKLYYTCKEGAGISPQELSSHISSFLPAYMLPDRVEALEYMPRTFTGKLDRKLLARRRRHGQG